MNGSPVSRAHSQKNIFHPDPNTELMMLQKISVAASMPSTCLYTNKNSRQVILLHYLYSELLAHCTYNAAFAAPNFMMYYCDKTIQLLSTDPRSTHHWQ